MALWPQVLEKLGVLASRELKDIKKLAIIGPNSLAIQVAARYNWVSETQKDTDRVSQIEKALFQLTGHQYKVRIESPTDDTESMPGDNANGTGSPRPPSARGHGGFDLETAPELVKRASEILGASVMLEKTDPDFGKENP